MYYSAYSTWVDVGHLIDQHGVFTAIMHAYIQPSCDIGVGGYADTYIGNGVDGYTAVVAKGCTRFIGAMCMYV